MINTTFCIRNMSKQIQNSFYESTELPEKINAIFLSIQRLLSQQTNIQAEVINATFFFGHLPNGGSLRDNFFKIAESIIAIRRFLARFFETLPLPLLRTGNPITIDLFSRWSLQNGLTRGFLRDFSLFTIYRLYIFCSSILLEQHFVANSSEFSNFTVYSCYLQHISSSDFCILLKKSR